MTTVREASMAPSHLKVMHVTPLRVRLRYGDNLADADVAALIALLEAQSWVRDLHQRAATRSIVLHLVDGCSELRWRLVLADLGFDLSDPPAAPGAVSVEPTWERMARQIGGNMLGATVGQLLFGGAAGAAGAWLIGPRAGLILGACGALVGSVVGSVAGGELADGESPLRKGDLGSVSLSKIGGKLGEEAGWSTGGMLGAALAGPAGAVAGMTLGSIVAGQAVEDLISNRGRANGVGRLSWLVRLGEDQAGERATETMMGSLGRGLSGGQEWGAQLGTRLGGYVGRKIDWAGSWSRRQLVSRLRPRPVAPAT